jgi:hypothetical protein
VSKKNRRRFFSEVESHSIFGSSAGYGKTPRVFFLKKKPTWGPDMTRWNRTARKYGNRKAILNFATPPASPARQYEPRLEG